MTMVPATGKKKKEKRRKNVNFKLKKKSMGDISTKSTALPCLGSDLN